MFVKKYIAKDMQEAMNRIRSELGPDAMILSTRQVRQKGLKGLFSKRVFEVMAAYEPRPSEEPVKKDDRINQINERINELFEAVESFHDRISLQNSEVNMPEELGRIYKKLLASDVNQDVARRLTERVSEIYARVKDDPEKILHSLLCETVGETYTIKPKKYKTNVVILIGPTGVGKTTTLVKLAGLFAVDHGQKVGIINTDTYRVAAQEQLKTYSNIMKIPLCTVYSPPEMEAALELMKDRDVLLIDTAGKSSYSYDYRKEIEEYLSYCNADEVLLCVSATTNYATSKDLINNYSFCEDYKLVITKCDETNVAGNIINIASYAKKPVAFMTMGQNVPYDIEPLDPEKIAKRILERRKSYGPSADA